MSGRPRPSAVYLVADTRERHVLPFLETELKEHAHAVRQINTGDYLICRAPAGGGTPAVLACLERKTLPDFAASFSDGRYANLRKMLELRARTGCQLFFLVEGPAFPSPGRRFGRVPYASILTAITHLMVRDGVFVVQTEDESHTAKRLADLLRAFDAVGQGAADGGAGGAAPGAGGAAPGASEPPPGAGEPLPGAGGPPSDGAPDDADSSAPVGALAVPAGLTAVLEPTDAEAVTLMWAALRGISVVLGRILAGAFSVAELATGAVSIERVRALKTASGRPANPDAISGLLAVRAGGRAPAVKLIAGLRGFTAVTAARLLDVAGGLAALCRSEVEGLARISLPQKTRAARLGKKAARLRRLLHFRIGAEPPAAPPPRALGRGVEPRGPAGRAAAALAGAPAAPAAPAPFGGATDAARRGQEPPPLSDTDVDALLLDWEN